MGKNFPACHYRNSVGGRGAFVSDRLDVMVNIKWEHGLAAFFTLIMLDPVKPDILVLQRGGCRSRGNIRFVRQ